MIWAHPALFGLINKSQEGVRLGVRAHRSFLSKMLHVTSITDQATRKKPEVLHAFRVHNLSSSMHCSLVATNDEKTKKMSIKFRSIKPHQRLQPNRTWNFLWLTKCEVSVDDSYVYWTLYTETNLSSFWTRLLSAIVNRVCGGRSGCVLCTGLCWL